MDRTLLALNETSASFHMLVINLSHYAAVGPVVLYLWESQKDASIYSRSDTLLYHRGEKVGKCFSGVGYDECVEICRRIHAIAIYACLTKTKFSHSVLDMVVCLSCASVPIC